MRHPLLVEILASLALAGCAPADDPFAKKVDSVACQPLTGATCPAPADVDPAALSDLNDCDLEAVEVTATEAPDPSGAWPGDSGALFCCYSVLSVDTDPTGMCAIGRPLLDHGAPVLAKVDAVEGVAADWLRIAQMEHASVAAFHKLGLDLMAHGAPLELLDAVAEAARDEVRHARETFALASRYAGRLLAPGPMPVPTYTPASLAQLAADAAREGCVGETLGALIAAEAARVAVDPEVRAVMERVAADEARHAALSWRIVAWALHAGDVRDVVLAALRQPPALATFDHQPAVGLLGPEATDRLVKMGVRDVLDPAARVLLGA